MDTILSNADLQHAGVELGTPLRLPGEAGHHASPAPPDANPSATARVPLGTTSAPRQRNLFARKPPAAVAASVASAAASLAPAEAVNSSSRARRRRGRLLATIAVICVTGSAAAWVYRSTLSTLSVQHLDLARLSSSISGTVREAREAGQFVAGRIEAIGRMAGTPSAAPTPAIPASASPTPTLASRSAGQSHDPSTEVAVHPSAAALADFASLRSSPAAAVSGPSEVGAQSHTAGHAPTAVPPRSAPATDVPITVSVVTVPAPAASSAAPASAASTNSTTAASHFPAPVSAAPAAAEVKPVPPAEPIPSKLAATASAASTPGVVSAPQPAAPATVVPPAVPPAQDPATLASELTASPMSKADQVRTIGLVRELGAQLRDTRTQVSELQEALAHLSEQVATSNADIGSRLDFAEAATVLAQSAKAGAPPAAAATQADPLPAAVRPVSIHLPAKHTPTMTAPAAPMAPSDRRTAKDYVVKGASPGLAALAALRPEPGEPGVLEIGVGDPVPGLGRVKSIYQRGTTWVVQTENGLIQQ